MEVLTVGNQFGINRALIDQMVARKHFVLCSTFMELFHDLSIRKRGCCRCYLKNQMGVLSITPLGKMHLRADPFCLFLLDFCVPPHHRGIESAALREEVLDRLSMGSLARSHDTVVSRYVSGYLELVFPVTTS